MEDLFSGPLLASREQVTLSANRRLKLQSYNSRKLINRRSVHLISSSKLVYYRRSALRGRQPGTRAPRRELIRLLSDASAPRLARRNNNSRDVSKLLKREFREDLKLLLESQRGRD
jgi:hypothetical protein